MATSTKNPRNRAADARVDGLNPDDPGIGLVSGALRAVPAREILLVCCGDVPGVGAEATRLVLDVRERVGSVARAISVTDEPPESESEGFDHAVVWPRPHLGKDFSLWCLARGALALRPGGTLWCAARKSKGAESLIGEIGGLMGQVDVVGRQRGYRLVKARRGDRFDRSRARVMLETSYVIEDEVLGEVSLRSAPGVFSRRELDAGTRQLIEHAKGLELAPKGVLDLGCGVGPLGLWAARRWPRCRVLAVDSNLRAVALARDNVRRNGLDERVRVLASDGLPRLPNAEVGHLCGELDVALVNPPTHAEPETLGRLARDLRDWLAPTSHAMALLVVSRAGRMRQQLEGAGARVQVHAYARYSVLEARWDPPLSPRGRAEP